MGSKTAVVRETVLYGYVLAHSPPVHPLIQHHSPTQALPLLPQRPSPTTQPSPDTQSPAQHMIWAIIWPTHDRHSAASATVHDMASTQVLQRTTRPTHNHRGVRHNQHTTAAEHNTADTNHHHAQHASAAAHNTADTQVHRMHAFRMPAPCNISSRLERRW